MGTTDNQLAMKHWVGKCKYPNKPKNFYAGTLFIEADAKDNEVTAAFTKMWLEILPEGFTIEQMIPGQIWFVPAKENH